MLRIAVVALSLGVVTLAQADTGLTLKQLADLEHVEEMAVSPDGERIAYTRQVPREPGADNDGPAWAELHVIGPAGENRPYITGEENVSAVSWAPDGESLLFLAKRDDDEHTGLYRIPVAGGEARRVAGLETDISAYSLAPDGQRVALVAREAEDDDRKARAEKGFDQVVFEEETRPRRLWIRTLDNAGSDEDPVAFDGSVQAVRWSPAGDRLAVKSAEAELIDPILMSPRIHILDTDGTVTGRVSTPGKLGAMRWSPDGRHLAVLGTNLERDTREGRLLVVGRDGGEPRDLLPDLPGHVWQLDWLDDDTLIYVSYEGTGTRLGRIDADGGNDETLLAAGETIWNGLDVSGDGDIALTGHAAAHPAEVFRYDDGDPARLTDSNPWLADVSLAPQETITWQARDGLEIQGILTRPLEHDPDRRYPLVVIVHGGPESHYPDGWLTDSSRPAQVLAGMGYAVFHPNYRGSTGRGVEFALRSQGRPAKEEFDDIIDGVDHLVERGIADTDRVGITGGSYGGYATAWGATYYSGRYAAAVMNVGLSDKIAMLGTSDIPRELYTVHYRTWPWEDWEMYREASPIYYADRAQTPILILHGDADPRVDPTQSRILYRYITLQDDPPPARLVLYPGEGHGNRRAASRYDYSLRLVRWFDHYLKGPGGEPPPKDVDYDLPDDADGDAPE